MENILYIMMISMTGFGKAEGIFNDINICVELKSLNSKTFDLSLKLPSIFREKDIELRKILNQKIGRGKVECYISLENIGRVSEVKINQETIKNYIKQLKEIAPDGSEHEYLNIAVRLPDATNSKSSEFDTELWDFTFNLIEKALENFRNYRTTEGNSLCKEILLYIQNISERLSTIEPYEEQRIQSVKERYKNALKEFESIDETRYYQEVSYYIEKLDISEEKIRLKQHLKYFDDVMACEEANGKKLGFIAQEIGREINTIGSKANHSEIQKKVVEMKDELEKIKEQLLNLL